MLETPAPPTMLDAGDPEPPSDSHSPAEGRPRGTRALVGMGMGMGIRHTPVLTIYCILQTV